MFGVAADDQQAAGGGRGVFLGSGTDVMSADRLSFLHGCCQTLLRRAKVVYCVTVVCHCCGYSSTRAHVFMLKHGMSIGH